MMQTENNTPQDTQIPDGRMDISAEDLGKPTDEPEVQADETTPEGDDAGKGGETGDDKGADTTDDAGKKDDAGNEAGDVDAAKGEQGKDPARREVDGLKSDLIDTRKELRQQRERAEDLERQLQARAEQERAAQTRDYAAELESLDKRYDDGEFENFAEFQKARDEVIVARASEEALTRHQQSLEERRVADHQQAWNSAVDTFLNAEGNEAFRDDEILAGALATAIQSEFAKGTTDPQAVLTNAKAAVQTRLGLDKDPKAETEAERRKRQAAASAAGAAQVPSPVQGGGAGMRSQAGGIGELSPSTAARDWAAMSQAQQDEALGKPA